MDIHHLKVFRAAARASSFTRAGEEMLLSQSTVSLHIKELENEFGCALFTRSRKRVALSEAGRLLVPYVDRICAELKNAELAVREFSNSQRGTIRLATEAAPLIYLLPEVLADYHRKFPLIEVLVITNLSEVVLQQLQGQVVDLGIVMSSAEAIKSVQALPLLTEEMVFILSERHPLAQKAALLPDDLKGVSFISHLRDTALRIVQERCFKRLGIHPQILMELGNMEAIKSLVQTGMGIALVPHYCAAPPYGHGIVAKRIRGIRMSRDLLIAARDWQAHPPATIRLAKAIIHSLGGNAALKAASRSIDVFNLYD